MVGTLRSSLRMKKSIGLSSSNSSSSNENGSVINNLKRKAEIGTGNAPKKRERAAFGDITNNKSVVIGLGGEKKTLKTQMKKSFSNLKSNFSSNSSSSTNSSSSSRSNSNAKKVVSAVIAKKSSIVVHEEKQDESIDNLTLPSSQGSSLPSSQDQFKSIGEISLSDDDEYQSAEEDCSDASMIVQHSKNVTPIKSGRPPVPEGVTDYDSENASDPHQCSAYVWDIFEYYKQRESQFAVEDYVKNERQPEVSENMRAILVDWLVEVQESFELNHETLYTAVKIVDLYLSKEDEKLKKEDLQLVGATACLIACKSDERIPPLLDDFVYVCDDAYSREQIISMERKIIQMIDFDIGYPLSYRFLRRYGRVCKVTMPVLTLARYILEMALMEYELNIVGTSESKLAAAALILAFKIKGIDGWKETLTYYSGYSLSRDCGELVQKLFKLLKREDNSNLRTIKQKYSHIVFHEVAKVELPSSIIVSE